MPRWREQNERVFDATVRAAADQVGISAFAIEKDYWACRVLRAVVTANPGNVIFKGGTSLEKMRIIQRFSEDLDLLVVGLDRGRSATRTKLKEMCQDAVDEIPGGALRDPESGGNRGTMHRAVHLDLPLQNSPGGAIADPGSILLEFGQSGGDEPTFDYAVSSLLARALQQAGTDVAAHSDLASFTVMMIHPGRTLIEKLLRLNNFAVMPERRESTDGWARIGRQFYDVWALLGDETVRALLADRGEANRVRQSCIEASKAIRPDADPPVGGFANSRVFDKQWANAAELERQHDVPMSEMYYGNELTLSFDDVLSRVAANAELLDI